MRITKVEIWKFRSIEHLAMDVLPLTMLCGANSSGKSNVLRAIRFAFVREYTVVRLAANFPLFVTSSNANIRVKLSFDSPTPTIAGILGISPGTPWTYEVHVKRNGTASFKLNGATLSEDDRRRFLEQVLVVFVPPVRDIAGDGLLPFKRMLGDAIRQARGGTPLVSASSTLRAAVTTKGRQLLTGSQFPAIGGLEVDVADVDFESMLSAAVINVRTANGLLPLQGFGTGHQSQVVLGLYRQFGQGVSKFVAFHFEEPDNHMHSMGMRAIAEDLQACAQHVDSQVFVTTHSPALMNQFELKSAVGLVGINGRTQKRKPIPTVSARDFRVGLSQFGMRPAEALTARKVVVVEGATDVTLIRTLYKHHSKRDPERDDILIVPAGGKELATKLCLLLNEMGINWVCVLDFDAAQNDSQPYFQDGIGSHDQTSLLSAIDLIAPRMFQPGLKTPKAVKILTAMREEIAGGIRPNPTFNGSVVARLIDQLKLLSASDRAVVAKSIARRQHSKWRDGLSRSGVWLWSADPEELLIGRRQALDAAERVLRSSAALTGTFSNPEKLRQTVANKMHGLAAEPDLLASVLGEIFRSGPLGTDQFNVLARQLTN